VTDTCVFCEIASGQRAASVVYRDEMTLAFMDLHQFHAGHTLVIPLEHIPDVRDLNAATGAGLMQTVAKVTRAVDVAFPNEGISVWHSIGPAAFQEVPHLHVHVHPRRAGDGMLGVYPSDPSAPDRSTLDSYAARIRDLL